MSRTPTRISASAPAKTNLVLHVGSPTPDGYHPLETLFLAVELRETVTVGVNPALAGRGVGVDVSVEAERGSEYARMVSEGTARLSDVPLDETNLAVKAALAVCAALGVPVPGLELHVGKSVPVAGGMGGGSADAAAALVAVNELVALHTGVTPMGTDQLLRVAAGLGADVPFMLMGGAAIGRGTGTEVAPVPAGDQLHFVFVPQDQGLSTPAVYRRWDANHPAANVSLAEASGTHLCARDTARESFAPDPVPDAVLTALASADPDALAVRIRNDLQDPAIQLLPELEELLNHGVELGALAGWVSGSGPTVCFLARSQEAARRLVLDFEREHRHALAVVGPVPGARITWRE